MQHNRIHAQRYATLVARIAKEEQWKGGAEEVQAFVRRTLSYLPIDCSDAKMRMIVRNIRCDEGLVEALRCSEHFGHIEAWRSWLSQTKAILRHTSLDWGRDGMIDLEDLTQIALLELSRSLHTYRYHSRFTTWAYRVITQGVQRHLRDMAAQKRSCHVDPAIDPLLLTTPIADHDLPEQYIYDQEFSALVSSELHRTMNERDARIFLLWAYKDLPIEMIAQQNDLSVPRTYAIIKQARQQLQSYLRISDWKY